MTTIEPHKQVNDVPLEYKVENIDINWNAQELELFLNSLGIDRWRLVRTVVRENLNVSYGIFCRELGASEEVP